MTKTLFIVNAILMTIIVALVWSHKANAAESYNFDHVELVYTIDGDTVKVNIPWVHQILGKRINIRVKDIDADEIRPKAKATRRSFEARSFVQSALSSAKKISLQQCERGKYFRLACEVWYDGKSIGQELLSKGLADAL